MYGATLITTNWCRRAQPTIGSASVGRWAWAIQERWLSKQGTTSSFSKQHPSISLFQAPASLGGRLYPLPTLNPFSPYCFSLWYLAQPQRNKLEQHYFTSRDLHWGDNFKISLQGQLHLQYTEKKVCSVLEMSLTTEYATAFENKVVKRINGKCFWYNVEW